MNLLQPRAGIPCIFIPSINWPLSMNRMLCTFYSLLKNSAQGAWSLSTGKKKLLFCKTLHARICAVTNLLETVYTNTWYHWFLSRTQSSPSHGFPYPTFTHVKVPISLKNSVYEVHSQMRLHLKLYRLDISTCKISTQKTVHNACWHIPLLYMLHLN